MEGGPSGDPLSQVNPMHELEFDDGRPKEGLIRKETMKKLHESSVNLGTAGAVTQHPRTSLEQFDTFSKVTGLIMRNQDVSDWSVEDVGVWLKANP